MEAAELIRRVEAEGCRAALLPVEQISFDPAFRRACEQNTCGNFGKCWKCPPDAGPIEELIREAQTYDTALVLQTIGTLEDSFDFEGMMEAAHQHGLLLTRVRALAGTLGFSRWLLLGAGGCHVCETCARRTNEPCRHPDLATASLETYGVNVSRLASACGMKYVNGQNTVTYFGALLCCA